MITKLKEALLLFRIYLHFLFPKRRDAILNLLDALSSNGHHVSSIVQLSESDKFERKYSSITDAIADGLTHAPWDDIQRLVCNTAIPSKNSSQAYRFIVDCTSIKRQFANKLADRGVNHYPNPAPGNKPICVGHQYSIVAMLPENPRESEKRWVVPLSADRVKTDEKGNEVGMKQIINCIKKLDLKSNLCISIGDSLYSTKECRNIASQADNLIHIFRLNTKRNIYFSATEKENIKNKKGRKREFGEKLNLGNIDPKVTCALEATEEYTNHKGKTFIINIKCWNNMLLRGTREFRASEHPLNLIQVTVKDKNGDMLFKRPLYIGISGKRREEISPVDCYENYKRRYDIEHFFRFGKDKLLMDSSQTPDVEHEECWLKFCTLAYSQLYFAKELTVAEAKPWERYLPENKNYKIATPSQTQRGFGALLKQIGTPAKEPIPRGNPMGRDMGEKQPEREEQPIIFKSKNKAPKSQKSILLGCEKITKNQDPQEIDELLNSVLLKLNELNVTKENFIEMLQVDGILTKNFSSCADTC
jgi:hypothetical protein